MMSDSEESIKELPRIKASIPGISQCRSVIFDSTSSPKFRFTMTGPFQNFSLYKVGQQRFTMGLIPNIAYHNFLKIKEKKLQNIKFLVQHIEKEEDREFYKLLDQEAAEVDNNQEEESDLEEYE